ncbi:hypothetical protein ACFQ7Z_32925 [Streptomyces virginiae]|uniref:hypothetical protein n=1 Tax=Streptomyces virginiae TaxID=1961 RepID=UPI003690EB10
MVVPALTCGLIILSAVHGEQQRPAQQLYGMLRRASTLAPYVMRSHTGISCRTERPPQLR